MNYDPSSAELCGVYIDMGTTHTRAWLLRGKEIVASARAKAGVGDSARDKSREKIIATLKRLIAEVRAGGGPRPTFCIAAGMITSSLGLVEVPHLAAPAGERELAAGVQRIQFPEIADIPFFLVPGIRSGAVVEGEVPITADLMRGEETLCIGLLNEGVLKPGATLLTLGSHWKAIALDNEGRIAASISSLSGELLHAAQTQTILASSVAQSWPKRLDTKWLAAGMAEQKESGLARALYCVRSLQLCARADAETCFAFLCGAFIGADLDRLLMRRQFHSAADVVITGGEALSFAWQHALARVGIPSTVLPETGREDALLAGLRIFARGI